MRFPRMPLAGPLAIRTGGQAARGAPFDAAEPLAVRTGRRAACGTPLVAADRHSNRSRPRRFHRLWRHWRARDGSLAVSVVLHAVALIVLAGLALPGDSPRVSVEALLELAPAESAQTQFALPPPELERTPGPRGGSRPAAAMVEPWPNEPTQPVTPLPPEIASETPVPLGRDEPALRELGRPILGRKAAGFGRGGNGWGRGFGDGLGDGTGTGAGFFETAAEGTKFVYVLDCSGSMKEPHSEARNRLDRLKVELVHSIGGLPAASEFYVIFFNVQAISMPAGTLQPASVANKRKYLEWVVTVRGGGGTDPREALARAFALGPDVVYFLTDGAFDEDVPDEVARLNTGGVTVHTFCLGDAMGEDLLRRIAEANRGTYRFVP